MSRFKRMAAAGLAVGMSLSISVCAAAPTSTYEESYYINLDYYGASRNSNIVKSYSPNGQSSITDYGAYESIKNMSNYVEPTQSDGGVTFSFGNQIPSRFYFEAKTDAPLSNLPWTVSLGYKLNGVPADPATLAGAKGLVEIDLDLIPNKDAPEYFRNNLVLTAATTLDADKIYSVEAPGAQVQGLGNYKAIAFMAMPGEECHFVTRLGSDNFEFGGFTFLMLPITLSQMDQIKDLREAKETLEDSADAISKSLDIILDTMNSLSSSLNATADGLAGLDQARQIISAGKGQIYANLDQSLLDLGNLSNAMKPTTGDIKAAKETLSQVNKDLSALNTTAKSLKDNIASTTKVLKAIKTDTGNLQDLLNDLHAEIDHISINTTSLASSLDGLNTNLGNVDSSLDAQTIEVAPGVKLPISQVKTIISTTNQLKTQSVQAGVPNDQFKTFLQTALGGDAAKAELFYGIWANQTEINKSLAPLTTITGGLSDVSSGMGSVLTKTSTLLRSLSQAYNTLDKNYQGISSSLTDDGKNLSDEAIKALEKLDSSISQLDALYQTLNAYEPKAQSALDTVSTLADALTTGTLNLNTLFANSEALVKQSGTFLDLGASQTLNGLIGALRTSTKGLGQTGTIKNAKNTVKKTIDDKWDEYTGETNNLLLMDSTAVKPSLTSARNPAPQTIQILMRSDEITLKSQEEKIPVDESYVAEGNIFSRIGTIFHAIGSAVSSVFS